MKGHIRERSPGHWAIVIEMRDPATGKRRRKWHSFSGNKSGAQAECRRLLREVDEGRPLVEPSKDTLGAFLDRWLADVKGRISPKTHERYRQICRVNIVPALGSVPLARLDAQRISAAYSRALETRRDGKIGGLSAATVRYMHAVLRQALDQARSWKLIHSNPAEDVKQPKKQTAAMRTYNLAQTVDMIEAARGERVFIPALIAVMCGLRRGEIAALRWRSVDLDAGQLSVEQSAEQTKAGVRYKMPKSGRGRTVARSATMVAELKAHRRAQAEQLLKLGKRLGDDDFVVAREDGEPMRPHSFGQLWVRFLARHARCPGSGSTICDTLTRRTSWRPGFIPRSQANGWGIPRSASRSTFTATCCRTCKRMQSPGLTRRCKRRRPSRENKMVAIPVAKPLLFWGGAGKIPAASKVCRGSSAGRATHS